ncbi:hypothetical protein H0W26_03280 [Candidatus Dependentiae bacterium]|nr:hypothetical protein [Candidatus Dependentiae bacterium]
MKHFRSIWTRAVLPLALILLPRAGLALTTFIPRGQGEDTARRLVGWQRRLFQCYDENYTAHATTITYTRSRDTECIARKLFSTPCLTFAGSESPQRVTGDIVADYFGLPTDFRGTLAIKPRIDNIILDIDFYLGLDDISPGWFMRINAPINHTRWTLGLDECLPCADKFRGNTVFPDCYMNSTIPGGTIPQPPFTCPINATLIPRFIGQLPLQACNYPTVPPPDPRPVCEFKYNENCTTGSLREALSGNFVFGDMQTPWRFGRFDFCPRSKTAVADIEVITGYNFALEKNYHLSFFGIVVIPTGNRPKARYIFEPIVGDAKHWQLGAGFTTHYSFYNDEGPECRNAGFYIDAYCSHFFTSNQERSFDFTANGLLSRYILLKEFDINNMYTGTTINAINFATRNCKVSIPFKADISVKGYIAGAGWEFDLGYNFYFRAKEELCIKTKCPCPLDQRRFGIKGLEGVCCTEFNTFYGQVLLPTEGSPRLDTTQPNATMFRAELPTTASVSPTASEICLSWNSNPLLEDTPLTNLGPFVLANTTALPTIISCKDLDPLSARQGAIVSHKLFGHIQYTFSNSYYRPFIGIGGEIEGDGHNHNTLSLWGAWIKGGLSF